VAIATVILVLLYVGGSGVAFSATSSTVRFSSSNYSVSGAGSGVLTIPVLREGDRSGDAYVYLNVSGGTATYLRDFTLEPAAQSSTPLHFGPDVTEQDVRFTWTGGQPAGGDQMVIIRLIPVSGALTGSPDVALITIRGNTTPGSGTPTPAPSGSPIGLPTASVIPSGSPSGIITPSPTSAPSSSPAGAGTPTSVQDGKGTPTLVPLPSQSQTPFPGALFTLLAVISGCALLYRLKK
jgi:hypothetical protein